ncbi:MAG: DUF2236 domain-containing protein [Acidimicrobiia bacterium]|nr:DUF2236 domain-containing protein [Acidimicrobiia bacterium]NNC91236.1 DUF2236 domain-containing protein [Acidimicrobiia bacterium]
MDDPGFFGPNSMMWKVNRETTTMFGGASALLMHAAHPLIAAGARQTGGYRRDPWARLIRTLQLQHLVTFGSQRESEEAATRINKLHKVIHGVDDLTGEWYDALDWEQLLWVHAALEVATIDFYELTVAEMTTAEKDQYHEENKLAADLLLLPADFLPRTYADMEAYVSDMIGSGRLVLSDVAIEVAELITKSMVPLRIKPIWKFVAFAAVGTLDPRLRELYGITWTGAQQRWLDVNLSMIKTMRPLAPTKFRWILPARWAQMRLDHPPLVA